MRGHGSPPGTPADFRERLVEIDRHEWVTPQEVDFAELETFLRGHGITRGTPDGAGATIGAGLLLSGDIRSHRRSQRPAASPVPRVPAACAVVYGLGDARAQPADRSYRIGTWVPSWTPEDHAAAVAAVREAIAAGEVYQANIVGHQQASFGGAPEAAGAALLTLADTPYAGSLCGAGWWVYSASPECLLDVDGEVALTRPIKGTAATRADASADAAARLALLRSAKDRAEHVMIVDLARNDLGRIAEVGGVSVPELYAVRRLAGVWHAESTVVARVTARVGLAELLEAVFPGGSVTGAPKLAALDVIDRLEPVGRGPSMGAMGWIGADGTLRLGLTIRTVAIADGAIHLWTGGGITWGSDPAAEVAEAAVKAAPVLRALDAAR